MCLLHFFSNVACTILPNDSIVILHVDGDLYQSHKSTLENLYDKVSNGGVIIFDDIFYGFENSEPFPGARTAVKEFFNDKYNLLKVSIGGNLYCVKK